ncbi:hypothetical protein [Actinoplanes sp. NPDC049265]|uniref:hypothetical protein n=1 Tax=Actinoplanes sp. NPDC049265 TaxID=3363902 RepID=UPI00371D1BB8
MTRLGEGRMVSDLVAAVALVESVVARAGLGVGGAATGADPADDGAAPGGAAGGGSAGGDVMGDGAGSAGAGVTSADVLEALVVLRGAQAGLAALEPSLVAAARSAGVSWQELAPALGVGSRQAAERRFLRSRAGADHRPTGERQDDRVRAERDRRAGQRAVDQWANDHTAHLRRLAGQVTALTDLDESASPDVHRLQSALGATDATDLPTLLAETIRHLSAHPDLATRIDEIAADTARVRRETQARRDAS